MRGFPVFNSLVFENRTVTTYPSDATITAAELLGGLLVDTEAGASTFTLPTAALLAAAIPGIAVGLSFMFALRNTGNNTATVAVGTGITSASGNTLTVATVNTRIFLLICTGVASDSVPGSAYTFDLYSLAVSAH
jgi:hypothetical protein